MESVDFEGTAFMPGHWIIDENQPSTVVVHNLLYSWFCFLFSHFASVSTRLVCVPPLTSIIGLSLFDFVCNLLTFLI